MLKNFKNSFEISNFSFLNFVVRFTILKIRRFVSFEKSRFVFRLHHWSQNTSSVETSTTSVLEDDGKKFKNTYLDQGTCGINQFKKSKSRSKRVVGGTRAKYGKHPWIAHILVEGYSNCGGSVISKSWILTAAHCIVGEDRRYLTVVAGEYHARQKDDHEQRRGVRKLVLYPKYRIGSDNHDIGLLQLDMKLKFGKYVQPVCLPAFGRPVPTGKQASIMGWGETNAKGSKLQ